jgi:hypothetical protein
VRRRDDLAAHAGALEIAREDGGEVPSAEALGLRPTLALAALGQRDVEVTDEPPRLGEPDLAVAQEVDRGRASGRAPDEAPARSVTRRVYVNRA